MQQGWHIYLPHWFFSTHPHKVVGMKLKQTLMSQQNAMGQIFQMAQHASMFIKFFQD
jgi:hypothetical protein